LGGVSHQDCRRNLRQPLDDSFTDQVRSCLRKTNATRFEEGFRYDAKTGVPRVWKPDDDIDGLFQVARDDAEKMFDILKTIDIPIDDINEIVPGEDIREQDLQLLSETQREVLRERFRRDVGATYMDAKRSVINTQAHVPPWMILVTMALGWNEFVALVSNPIYFLLVLIFGGGGYALYATGLAEPVKRAALEYGKELTEKSGPVFTEAVSVAKSSVAKVAEVGHAVMESHRESGQVELDQRPTASDMRDEIRRRRNADERERVVGGWK
jgi:hypothetical protein